MFLDIISFIKSLKITNCKEIYTSTSTS